jgi:toxoflavin synthase
MARRIPPVPGTEEAIRPIAAPPRVFVPPRVGGAPLPAPAPAAAPVYDAIAEEYRRSKSLPFRLHIEAYTLFRLIGDPAGRTVLDLACGEGIYTREARRRGASDGFGVDLSGEMIRLAEEAEVAEPLGCRYVVSDVADLPALGRFDLVLGVYLLNYARTAEELLRFCRVVYANLRPGGCFVGFNDNVSNPPQLYGSYRAHGFVKSAPERRVEGDPITYTLFNPDGGEFQIVNYYLSPDTYVAAFREAGFRWFEWCEPWLSEEGERSFPPRFWDDFLSAPPVIGMRAEK